MNRERPQRRVRADGARSRQTILRAAADLATVDGLDGLSIGNLAAHIGMSKSGLYAHFGSKEELQLAAVETARAIFDTEVVQPTEAIVDPLERARALCEGYLSYVERRVFPGGCFFASTGSELAMRPGPVRDEIASVHQGWRDRLRRALEEAQAGHSLDAGDDPAQLAFELHAYLLMGNDAFLLHDDPTYLERARTAIAGRLSRATRAPR
jgi:AcrR family transcriptional regulator